MISNHWAPSDGSSITANEKEQAGNHLQPDVACFYRATLLQHLYPSSQPEFHPIILIPLVFIIVKHNATQDSQLTMLISIFALATLKLFLQTATVWSHVLAL